MPSFTPGLQEHGDALGPQFPIFAPMVLAWHPPCLVTSWGSGAWLGSRDDGPWVPWSCNHLPVAWGSQGQPAAAHHGRAAPTPRQGPNRRARDRQGWGAGPGLCGRCPFPEDTPGGWSTRGTPHHTPVWNGRAPLSFCRGHRSSRALGAPQPGPEPLQLPGGHQRLISAGGGGLGGQHREGRPVRSEWARGGWWERREDPAVGQACLQAEAGGFRGLQLGRGPLIPSP